jgi:hypothetical protein
MQKAHIRTGGAFGPQRSPFPARLLSRARAAAMAAVSAAEAAPSLAAMPPEVLLQLLRFAGPRAAACAACACVRLRDAQREVAAVPLASFSSALVRMVRAPSANPPPSALVRRSRAPPQAAAGSPVAQASAAAAEATKMALDGLQSFSGGDGVFALVLCSPAAGGATPRQSLAAALEAALQNLPAGVPALGVTGATVWGPELAAGGGHRIPRDVPRAVSVLLARVPGCHVAITTDGTYPDLGAGQVTAADPRLAAWLGAPASADPASLAFCALFLAPRRQPPFEASPHVSRAWPGAALVGGVASARGGAGAVATAVRAPCADKPDVRPCRDAAALSVFARAGGRAPRTAAHATRGLRPCGAVWSVSTLVRAAAVADAPGDDPGALVPFLLRSGGLVAAPAADGAAFDSESLWHDVFVTSFELQAAAFVRVWRAGDTPAEDAAARAAARAVPAECAQDGAVADAEVLLWVPPGVFGASASFTAALAEGRLRCQVLRVDADVAAEDAAATATRLADAVGAPDRPAAALAAACSARGAFLFRSEGEEARALAGRFPDAFIGLTVDGELGPPPEGGAPMLQSFTTTAAALSA